MSFLLVNFKSYENGSGKNGLALAKRIESVAKETEVRIAVAVQPGDISRISQEVSIPVYSQCIDPIDFGPHTGSILAENVKENGAGGALLNHAERKLGLVELKKVIAKCKELQLTTIVSVGNKENAQDIIEMKPDYMVFEYPEVNVSGKTISQLPPETLKEFVKLVKGASIPPFCGVGIASREDIKTAREWGAEGFVVDSAILESTEPEKRTLELALAVKE